MYLCAPLENFSSTKVSRTSFAFLAMLDSKYPHHFSTSFVNLLLSTAISVDSCPVVPYHLLSNTGSSISIRLARSLWYIPDLFEISKRVQVSATSNFMSWIFIISAVFSPTNLSELYLAFYKALVWRNTYCNATGHAEECMYLRMSLLDLRLNWIQFHFNSSTEFKNASRTLRTCLFQSMPTPYATPAKQLSESPATLP